MPPQLLALTDGPSILLDKPILLLGRHQECDIQLVSRKVSRRHCCIAQVGKYLVVRDLGSTNGIRINGIKVNEGSLKPGDELTIGNYRYELRWETLAGEMPVRRKRSTEVRQEALPPNVSGHFVGDDILESCDEPIPLAEPDPFGIPNLLEDSLPPKLADARPDAHRRKHDEPAPSVREPAPSVREPASLILPEMLELAPLSDSLPPINPLKQ
jgi:predicted component of type VI protein secretion system